MRYGILTFQEPKPDISHKILHVDMDAFYASIEIRDNPDLKNRPVVIARHPQLTQGRGIVTTCNYIARQYGIYSAMSAKEAYDRCRHAVFIPPNIDYYRQISQSIHHIFRQYTDLIEPVSLDEAYLDVTDNKKKINSGTIIAQQIQSQIEEELHLTCSVGVSYNKYIAKIASDFKKPHGITVVEPTDAAEFLKQLDIKKFPGVGRKTYPQFIELGIESGADLYEKDLEFLIQHFGKLGYTLYYKVRGVSNFEVKPKNHRKSYGRERTFAPFLVTPAAVNDQLERLAQLLDRNGRIKELRAYTVTLKVRYENFDTLTRQTQLFQPVTTPEEVVQVVSKLWQEHGDATRSVRLLGITLSNFDDPLYSPMRLF